MATSNISQGHTPGSWSLAQEDIPADARSVRIVDGREATIAVAYREPSDPPGRLAGNARLLAARDAIAQAGGR